MQHSHLKAPSSPLTSTSQDVDALPAMVDAVQEAGRHVEGLFSSNARPTDLDAIRSAIAAHDEACMEILQRHLSPLYPKAGWADEAAGGLLPPGEWWVVDPVEGAINHIHGMTDWAVTATLVRDNVVVATVVHLPLAGATYTALRGGGAHLDGVPLQASAKTDLGASLVGTGQALPGESIDTHERIGRSVVSMLSSALVVQVSVPATLQLIQVAAGRRDAFWQFSQVRSGLVAGALLVEEAGGLVTDTAGHPWTLASADILAAAPGVHAAAVSVLTATE